MSRLILPSRRRGLQGFTRYTPSAGGGGGGEVIDPGAIYMARDGNDTTGDGTIENPYRSLAKIQTVVAPGDTVYLRGGYYDEVGVDTYLTDAGGSAPSISFSGTSGSPITIRSYPGEWAVFDGGNHPDWPLTFDATPPDAYEPRMLMFTGEWVNWEYLEFRNSVGGGCRFFILDCKMRYSVFQNNHAVAFAFQGSRNEVAGNLFQDNYSVENDGASANGMMIRFSDQLTQAGRFPGETESGDNHLHHNVARNNSDDGFSTNTANRSIVEYNLAYDNGYGATGDGIGFKMGFSGALNTGTICRFNMSWNNGNVGYNTNYSTGVQIYNCVDYGSSAGGFATWVTSTPGSGDNEVYNCLYHGASISIYRESGVTIHESNAAYTEDWYDRPPNYALGDPQVISFDETNDDFLKLGASSPYLSNGQLVDGRTGAALENASATLGAIPDGEDFAGGWNWRALIAAYPSHGLRSRTTMNALTQGTRTPYPAAAVPNE